MSYQLNIYLQKVYKILWTVLHMHIFHEIMFAAIEQVDQLKSKITHITCH